MKQNNYIRLLTVMLITLYPLGIEAQEDTLLNSYLQEAADNSAQLKSDFALYKAALEKVPQAGAYPDPELEMGFFIQPMEIIDGKQVADFTLMQMFPWFGTRKAARNEATEMARMSYEQFRESRDNLFFEIKSQWYTLASLHMRYRNTETNINLLRQLEELAVKRYSSAALRSGAPAASAQPVSVAPAPAIPSSGGMGSMSMGASTPAASPASAGMSGMDSGGGMSGNAISAGNMSDVLRIQLEIAELENNLSVTASAIRSAEALFNALLNRDRNYPVEVPDILQQSLYTANEEFTVNQIIASNPMLGMIEAEGQAYRAKAEMDKKMSYPMLGIGLQYSVIGKRAEDMSGMGAMSSMNGRDMIMPMVKLSLPLWRGKYKAQQRESNYYRQASEMKYEDTLNRLMAEYVSTTQLLSDAARRIDLYERQHELSRSTYQLMVREFASGLASLTDIIQIERQMLDYQIRKFESIADYNTQVAAIQRLISIHSNH